MPSIRTDVAWGDEAISSQDGNVSSNLDSNFGIDVEYRGFSSAKDPLLKDCTYEQLLSEIARRNLDIQEEVTFELVKKTYRIEKELGKGVSGVVHLVYHKGLKRRFACKVIEKNGPVNDLLSMTTEVEIMKRVRHPRIVSLYELYESPKCMWMILELVEAGGLRGKLSLMLRRFSENVALRLIKQILEGISYMHNQGIVHRDIKIDNILYQGDVRTGSIKIADFGLSALIKGGENGYPSDPLERKKYRDLKATWGTPTHYSPELTYGAYGPQTDMWSLGCVVYEMLTGFNAFPPSERRVGQPKHKDLFLRIRNCNYKRSNLNHISSECRDFLDKLFQINPEVRMSAEEALQHPWILSSKPDVIRKRIFPQKFFSWNLFGCMRSRCLDARDVHNSETEIDNQNQNENENENETGSVSVQSAQSEARSVFDKRNHNFFCSNSAMKRVQFIDEDEKYCNILTNTKIGDRDRDRDNVMDEDVPSHVRVFRKNTLFCQEENENLNLYKNENDNEIGRPKMNKIVSYRDDGISCQMKKL